MFGPFCRLLCPLYGLLGWSLSQMTLGERQLQIKFFFIAMLCLCVWPARSGTGTDGDWGRNCGGIWSGEDCSFCGWKPYDMAVLLFGWWVRAIPSMQIKMPFWPLGGALSQLMMDHSVKCSWVELRLVRLVTSVLFQWQKAPNAIEYKAHGRFLFL